MFGMSWKGHDRMEHYEDKTANMAIAKINREQRNKRFRTVIHAVRGTLKIFGFELMNRMVLRDNMTGRIYR